MKLLVNITILFIALILIFGIIYDVSNYNLKTLVSGLKNTSNQSDYLFSVNQSKEQQNLQVYFENNSNYKFIIKAEDSNFTNTIITLNTTYIRNISYDGEKMTISIK
jgi:hypothetical protein